MSITSLVFASLISVAVGAESKWDYGATYGPSQWNETFPNCNGKSQSPIAIESNLAENNKSLGEFSRSLFDNLPTSITITNNGHSIQMNLEGGYIIDEMELLPATFQAAQYHIHWAKAGEKGSEHTLDGKQYFGELHIVHYNTKYGNLSNAASEDDGLAVLGFFIEDDYKQNNLDFDQILAPFTNDSYDAFEGFSEKVMEPFSIETLLPPDYDVYYRYKGSLTTPACYESVVWTVFDTPIRISRAQAEILEKQIYKNNETQIAGNFRPPQPLNDRTVEIFNKSSACKSEPGAAPTSHLSLITLFSALVLSFIFSNF